MTACEIRQIITDADADTLCEFVKAIISRYSVLFPDEEVIFLSLPTDDKLHRQTCIEAAFKFLQK